MSKENKYQEKNIDIENDKVNENEENSDINFEETTSETETTEDTDTIEETDELEAIKRENEDIKDKYLRTVAEFENYKKRTLKEKTELILNGSEKTVSAILPVLDDMERALANSDKTNDIDALKEGMDLIYKKLIKTLEGLGVNKIETLDKDFNVDYHEAVAMVPGMDDDKKGKVIDCIQTGYTLNDKVIRHAKVAVGQ